MICGICTKKRSFVSIIFHCYIIVEFNNIVQSVHFTRLSFLQWLMFWNLSFWFLLCTASCSFEKHNDKSIIIICVCLWFFSHIYIYTHLNNFILFSSRDNGWKYLKLVLNQHCWRQINKQTNKQDIESYMVIRSLKKILLENWCILSILLCNQCQMYIFCKNKKFGI